MTAPKLTAAVEAYLTDLRAIRATGGATAELSYHTPLNNLLTAVGATLKPRVRCVGELADLGAGHPDLGLYSTTQRSRRGGFETRPPRSRIPAELPDCGVVEIKPASDDAWLTVDSDQVSKYWNKYRLNDRACWRNIPAAVWNYKPGGYQVLKKWLSYREHKVLQRPLHPHEVQHFTNTARHITAILGLTR